MLSYEEYPSSQLLLADSNPFHLFASNFTACMLTASSMLASIIRLLGQCKGGTS